MSKNDYYEKNAEKYIEISKDFDMSIFYNYVENEINILDTENPKILDLGFGSARDMLYFNEKGFDIEGLDYSLPFIENAESLGLKVYQEELPSMETIPKDILYDIIYSVGLLMHLDKKDRIKMFKNIKLNLSIGGLLILSYNTLDRTSDPERDFFLLNEEEINEEVGMTLINKEVIRDKRGVDWITATYIR